MKVIYVLLILLLLPLSVSSTEDLSFTLNYDYLINKTCIVANTEYIIKIPIYTGTTYISTPLHLNNPSLDGIFINATTGDSIQRFINGIGFVSANFYTGWGWYGNLEAIEPIEPCIAYIYNRVGTDYNITLKGTYLSKDDTCNIYSYFNFKNMVGTNIIKPKRSIYDE